MTTFVRKSDWAEPGRMVTLTVLTMNYTVFYSLIHSTPPLDAFSSVYSLSPSRLRGQKKRARLCACMPVRACVCQVWILKKGTGCWFLIKTRNRWPSSKMQTFWVVFLIVIWFCLQMVLLSTTMSIVHCPIGRCAYVCLCVYVRVMRLHTDYRHEIYIPSFFFLLFFRWNRFSCVIHASDTIISVYIWINPSQFTLTRAEFNGQVDLMCPDFQSHIRCLLISVSVFFSASIFFCCLTAAERGEKGKPNELRKWSPRSVFVNKFLENCGLWRRGRESVSAYDVRQWQQQRRRIYLKRWQWHNKW